LRGNIYNYAKTRGRLRAIDFLRQQSALHEEFAVDYKDEDDRLSI
jgi:hypothetical protein